MSDHIEGKLLIIGGAEDKQGEQKILNRFVQEAGGRDSRITVLTVATEYPREIGKEYEKLFTRLGAGEVNVIDVPDRVAANASGLVSQIESTTGVFFTGGDQLRITGLLGGTKLGRLLHGRYEDGIIMAGTSAGASAMSDTMIVGGEAGSPKKDRLTMAPGLGLLRSVVIDQHFAQRGRIGRLLAAVAQNPYVLGIGIDEDTAICVGADGQFTVLGSQTVTVVDAANSFASNVSETVPGQALVLTPIMMHILPEGFGFDLKNRTAILPSAAAVNTHGRKGKE